jgi:hypothetical protein
MSKNRRTRGPAPIPQLVKLRYLRPEGIYCQGCGREDLKPGMLVAWWPVPFRDSDRKTCFCPECHRARENLLRHGRSTPKRRRTKRARR